jgi:hypothetical protein
MRLARRPREIVVINIIAVLAAVLLPVFAPGQ